MTMDEIVKGHVKAEVRLESDRISEKMEESITSKIVSELKTVKPLEIKIEGKIKKIKEGIRHQKTDVVLNYISQGIPTLLVGPAGSGKTHIAVDCADILGIKRYSISVNDQTSKVDFLGYNDANGKIVKTNFRKTYEEGGLFIIDEIDAGNPNVLTVVNSALSNDFCPFPDGMVERHKDFVVVCTANTFGQGESMQYIGRNILDSATKDRFACIFIDYSELIEKSLMPKYYNMIKELRGHFDSQGDKIVISTRGGERVEKIARTGEIKVEDVIDCLNLHQETKRDRKIVEIISKNL